MEKAKDHSNIGQVEAELDQAQMFELWKPETKWITKNWKMIVFLS